MATVVNSIGILGLEGYLINVEVSIYSGLAMTSIVGLGDGAVKEAKERVETCLNKLDYIYPKKKIVINLSPSDIKKSGSYFDLAIIIGILLESEQIYPQKFNMGEYIFLGEISLNGELKSIHGVLPMVIAAKKKGFTKIILPSSCRREGSVVGGMEIFSFDNINQIINNGVRHQIQLWNRKISDCKGWRGWSCKRCQTLNATDATDATRKGMKP